MKITLLLACLLLPLTATADQCEELQNDAYIVSVEMESMANALKSIRNEILRIETVLMSDTLDEIELDGMYTKYIESHIVQRQLEAEYRSLEDRSFMIEIWRIGKCRLPVTYRPKKRNKKA